LSPWATLSPDRSWVAAVDTQEDGTSHLYEWNAATGAQRARPLQFPVNVQIQGIYNAVFSPDGSLIATNAQADKILVAASSTLKVKKEIPTSGDIVTWVAFSPDGRYLAAALSSGTIRLWRTTDWRQVGSVLALPQSALSVAFDAAGRLLATTSQLGTTTLWTVPGLQAVGSGLPSRNDTADSLGAASSFAGSSFLARVYAGGQANLWPVTTAAWRQHACSIAGRNLTHAEWKLYVGSDTPYQKTCPQFPDGG
jgi:WD40 repeat protein